MPSMPDRHDRDPAKSIEEYEGRHRERPTRLDMAVFFVWMSNEENRHVESCRPFAVPSFVFFYALCGVAIVPIRHGGHSWLDSKLGVGGGERGWLAWRAIGRWSRRGCCMGRPRR